MAVPQENFVAQRYVNIRCPRDVGRDPMEAGDPWTGGQSGGGSSPAQSASAAPNAVEVFDVARCAGLRRASVLRWSGFPPRSDVTRAD